MYTIDLLTILQLLREFRRSGILRTEIPAGLARLKQPCFVVIELLRGEVIACHVKDSKGQTLLSEQNAFEAVSAAGKLNWVFDTVPEYELSGRQPRGRPLPGSVQTSPLTTGPLQTPPALPVAPRTGNLPYRARVPRRLLQLSQAEVSAWPRKHRQVYVLIDGMRSVEKIAAMLSAPSQAVEEVLQEIQATGAIILEER